jgi:hypothetical protein
MDADCHELSNFGGVLLNTYLLLHEKGAGLGKRTIRVHPCLSVAKLYPRLSACGYPRHRVCCGYCCEWQISAADTRGFPVVHSITCASSLPRGGPAVDSIGSTVSAAPSTVPPPSGMPVVNICRPLWPGLISAPRTIPSSQMNQNW